MLILWRYCLKHFFRNFLFFFVCLNVIAFLTKFSHIVDFIASGASYKQIAILFLGLVPCFFPFVLAICCLLSAFLTVSKFSQTSELIAMQSAGLSLRMVCFPILSAALLLSILNLFIISELTPYSRYKINAALLEESNINPLILIKKQKLPYLKDAYVQLDLCSNAKSGENLLVIKRDPRTKNLLIFQSQYADLTDPRFLKLTNNALMTSFSGKDHKKLLIDSSEKLSVPMADFASMVEKKTAVNNLDISSFYHLKNRGDPRSLFELMARTIKAFLPFILTLLGLSVGAFYKKRRLSQIFFVTTCTLFCLVAYFLTKVLLAKVAISYAAVIFLLPFFLTLLLSDIRIRRIERGHL